MNYDSNILARLISGNCTPEEVERIQNRLSEDRAIQEEHAAFSRVWDQAFHHDPSRTEEGWDAFKAIVKAPKEKLGFDWLKVAASIALLAAFSVAIYFYSPRSQDIHASYQQIAWPDATTVVLDGNTEVNTLVGYGKSARAVDLDGQAYFDVAGYPLPFTMELNEGKLVVTGTRFTVLDPGTEAFTAVELYEGAVNFTDHHGVIHALKPGDRLISAEGQVRIEDMEQDDVHWIYSDELVCRDMSLEQIMYEVCHQYSLRFDIPKRALQQRYTLSLPKNDREACIAMLAAVSELDLRLEEDLIHVTP